MYLKNGSMSFLKNVININPLNYRTNEKIWSKYILSNLKLVIVLYKANSSIMFMGLVIWIEGKTRFWS